jgi:ribulose-phosphate 3-epimerase
MQTLQAIRASGARAALAVKPATSFSAIEGLIPELDMLLVMTVEPGFGGQSFMNEMMPKISQAREAIEKIDREIWLQVDGGISVETIAIAAQAGADAFVAGSAVYRAQSPSEMLETLRKLALGAAAL